MKHRTFGAFAFGNNGRCLGVSDMATKSILKNIVIKDKKATVRLVNALEQSTKKRDRTNRGKVSYSYANSDELRRIFSDKSE